MSLALRVTPQADSQIQAIDTWWRANRPAASDLFVNELEASFELIQAAPEVGRLYRRGSNKRVRRVLLNATRYHIYYIRGVADIWILAVWHAQRGVGPPLRIR